MSLTRIKKTAVKLILQIALGVFLGTLGSQLSIDGWRSYRDGIAKKATEKIRADQEKARLEQGERIRALLLQGRQNPKPRTGFIPDDAQPAK